MYSYIRVRQKESKKSKGFEADKRRFAYFKTRRLLFCEKSQSLKHRDK